jgi:hypothetical protein
MSYLTDTIKWGTFESEEEMMTDLTYRLAAKFLASFVIIVMPDPDHHPEKDKTEDEMIAEVQRLALDFVQTESFDDALKSELVERFMSWDEHQTLEIVRDALKKFKTKGEEPEKSIH